MTTAASDLPDNRKSVSNLLFGFHGRIDRQWWWLAILALVSFEFALGEPNGTFLREVTPQIEEPTGFLLALGQPLEWSASLVLFWPYIAIDVKRWHDQGRSGMCVLLVYAPLAFAVAISTFKLDGVTDAPTALGIAAVVLLALGLIVSLLALGFVKGSVGHNDYGPHSNERTAS